MIKTSFTVMLFTLGCCLRNGNSYQRWRQPILRFAVRSYAHEPANEVPVPSMNYRQIKPELMKYVRERDFESTMRLYERLKGTGATLDSADFYVALLNVCYRGEHAKQAQQLFDDMKKKVLNPPEAAYLALIRCYSDNRQIEKVMDLIRQMEARSLEPKLRTYQPLVKALCELENDPYTAIQVVLDMQSRQVQPRSEQIVQLLESSFKADALKNSTFRFTMEKVIDDVSKDLLGIDFSEMLQIVRTFNGHETIEAAQDAGILVENAAAIPGEVLIDNSLVDGTVVAANTTFSNAPSVLHDSVCAIPVSDPSIPIGLTHESAIVELVADKYVLRRKTNATNSTGSFDSGNITSSIYNREQQEQEDEAWIPAQARIVDIHKDSCTCPNCGGVLSPLMLTDHERKLVREALTKAAATTSVGQFKQMQQFAAWLKNENEFSYVVDAANVAYQKQNFGSGKFSFKQIELVVDKLLDRKDGRVLVILPHVYSQKIIPNNANVKKFHPKRVTSQMTSEDEVV